jgi:N-acetyl-1-D-myo-inositol-2-amino-2-deoxy-alpha-D-glucopyranoside deacetylase
MVARLLLLHAHPDDEAITTGGLIHFAIHQGAQVMVVTATAGECGEVLNSEVTPEPSILAQLRASELANSLIELGSPGHRWLGSFGTYLDSGMSGDPRNSDPLALVNQNIEKATQDFLVIVNDFQPNLIVTYEPGGGYGHPDHIRCNQIVQEARKKAKFAIPVLYPVYPKSRSAELAELATGGTAFFGEVDLMKMSFLVKDDEIDFELPATSAKLTALLSYRSQINPAGSFYQRSAEKGLTGIETEYFQIGISTQNYQVLDRANPLLGLG